MTGSGILVNLRDVLERIAYLRRANWSLLMALHLCLVICLLASSFENATEGICCALCNDDYCFHDDVCHLCADSDVVVLALQIVNQTLLCASHHFLVVIFELKLLHRLICLLARGRALRRQYHDQADQVF